MEQHSIFFARVQPHVYPHEQQPSPAHTRGPTCEKLYKTFFKQETFIQKPKRPSSQKIALSNYKHRNTAKLLIGITPDGVISFVPPLWTGMSVVPLILNGSFPAGYHWQ